MGTEFYFLLFYIFRRNFVAFDKELAILHGVFNLRISKKTTILWGTNFFFFFLKFLFNFI